MLEPCRLEGLEIDQHFERDEEQEPAGALIVLADAIFRDRRRQIAGLAVKSRLPSISGMPEYADAGGLVVYGADLLDLERRAAIFVDNLTVAAHRPAGRTAHQVELIINLKTAKTLGITIPPSVLMRADRVIN